ncbi:hypothetical protein Afil01_50240 [Actinorhabdospora filicis]|uniref:Uncharacterized protein n=1 Tax=Actinorhabdospora filicis TaxID=1785913 RepID=A0A9W6SQC1_9ACTN|nr:hypothetical protein [Actinorhabdospora filicis]GLZ80217.1 hypothetical protein Afil01_50240 [Actinorhabdospora filicis]
MPAAPTHCTHCRSADLTPGFLGDMGGRGFTRWIAGRLERGVLGGAKMFGRPKLAVEAFRCGDCGHLELFAVDE